MIKVSEVQVYNETHFKIDYFINNELTHSETVNFKPVILKDSNKLFYILYNQNFEPIYPVYDFINNHYINNSENTKEKLLYALKYLYTFLHIFKKELSNLTLTDIHQLVYFLQGISPLGNTLELNLKTTRSNKTINGYLSTYRSFIQFLDIKNSPLLLKSNSKIKLTSPLTDQTFHLESYKSSLKNLTQKFVPKYISYQEYQLILNLLRKDYTLREKCIIRLMYEGGLRIGEVLGLTAEDVSTIEIKENIYGRIILRNRISDKPFQLAKGCCEVKSIRTYQTKEYNTEGYGYEQVIVSRELLDLINDYIENAHLEARENHKKNYYKFTPADIVNPNEWDMDDINYYIFLNSLGRPLSDKSWNPILRKIFVKCNIHVDSNKKRENNLNHRFRHGFAMYHVIHGNIKALELKEMMRHRSLNSTLVYYNPTLEDIIEIKNNISNSIHNDILSSKGDLNEG